VSIWDFLQWPAMVTTLGSTWLVGSSRKSLRMIGFCAFLASNALWVAWGWHDRAWALVALQIGLAGLNVRGVTKNETSGVRL
jgi:hypothetical protein